MPKTSEDAPEAETVAGRALQYLAADMDRLGRFLAVSGLDPTGVRAASGSPGFLPAVLDYLLSDEKLLVAFATEEGLRPEAVAEARRALGRDEPFE